VKLNHNELHTYSHHTCLVFFSVRWAFEFVDCKDGRDLCRLPDTDRFSVSWIDVSARGESE
jgi:hypothetical protein